MASRRSHRLAARREAASQIAAEDESESDKDVDMIRRPRRGRAAATQPSLSPSASASASASTNTSSPPISFPNRGRSRRNATPLSAAAASSASTSTSAAAATNAESEGDASDSEYTDSGSESESALVEVSSPRRKRGAAPTQRRRIRQSSPPANKRSNAAKAKQKLAGDLVRDTLHSTQQTRPIDRKQFSDRVFKGRALGNGVKMTDVYDTYRSKMSGLFGIQVLEHKSKFLLRRQPETDDSWADKSYRAKLLMATETPQSKSHRAVVSLILSVILFKGGSITQQELEHSLFAKIDISQFGTVSKLLQQLKLERWIDDCKNADGEIVWRIGIRGYYETTPSNIYSAGFRGKYGNLPNPKDDHSFVRLKRDEKEEFATMRAEGKRTRNASKNTAARSTPSKARRPAVRGRGRGRSRK